MFAMFFGAGNMIFPPFLGNLSGGQWFLGFLCFILADAGLAIMTIFAMLRKNGTIQSMFRRLGKVPQNAITITAMTIVGPALCIPRTCATTFEMGMLPFFPEFPAWIFSGIFFLVAFVLIIRRSKVVDIIGKYMTPILLISLAVLIIQGIRQPLGSISATSAAASVAKEGFLAGYQTMDVLGSLAFTMVVIVSVREKGYTTHDSSVKIISLASVVAAVGLFLVYGGLTCLGATSSSLELGQFNQTSLLVTITDMLLGSGGKLLLAVTVLFACLTTAVGLASACCDFYYELFRRRVRYRYIAVGVCLVSMVISVVGITTMIHLATPMLNVLYPLLLTQIVLSFFDGKIKKDSVFQGAALGTLIVCCLGVAADHGAPTDFVHMLPLHSLGLYWIVPAILGGIIGALIPEKSTEREPS